MKNIFTLSVVLLLSGCSSSSNSELLEMQVLIDDLAYEVESLSYEVSSLESELQTAQSKADDAYNYAEENYSVLDDVVDDVEDIEGKLDCLSYSGIGGMDYCL